MHHAVPMDSFETRLQTVTKDGPEFVDMTDDIALAVADSGVRNGRATLFARDESTTIMVNERESGLLSDIKKTIARIAPAQGNGSGAVVGSSSVVLPVVEGKLRLGTWQRVLLVELSDSGERSVDIQIVGER